MKNLTGIPGKHPLQKLYLRRSYPFCHEKRQSDVLGGWMGKNIFMFCVTKWFQRKSHFNRKNINSNKKLQRTYVCFPFHHGSCTWTVSKFCLCNPRKKSPPSYFYSPQQEENRRDQWSSLECNVWNEVKDFVILIIIFSFLVE